MLYTVTAYCNNILYTVTAYCNNILYTVTTHLQKKVTFTAKKSHLQQKVTSTAKSHSGELKAIVSFKMFHCFFLQQCSAPLWRCF